MEARCGSCGRPISGADVLYSMEGTPLCPACHQIQDLHQTDLRAAGNISKAATSSLVMALVGFLINPFFVLTIGAIASGVYAIRSLSPDNDRFARHVATSRGLILTCAGIGIGLAALHVLAFVVRIVTS